LEAELQLLELGHDRLGTTAIYLSLTDTHVVDEYAQKW
jgi:hypothetical protein